MRAQLQYGETLQQFSARVLGDASQWPVIAKLNGLAPPYVSPVPGARLAVFGDTLIVPSATPDADPTATTAEEVFGIDVALRNGGFLAAESGDFALVAGRENLRQALGVRVTTDPGELLFHVDYGCFAARLKGGKSNPANALLAQAYVASALGSDVRVASVDAASVSISGDVMRVEAQCSAITGHPVNIKEDAL